VKAIVEGELLINSQLKIVFAGYGISTKLYVKGENYEWHWLRYVKSINLRVDPNQFEHIMLDIEVAVLNAEGELIGREAVSA